MAHVVPNETPAERKETGTYSPIQPLLMPAPENEKWQFTRAQLERLRAVTEEKSSARASIEARLAGAP